MDNKILVRMDAMIGSMTKRERVRPELLNAKRKIRVAKGSGTTVQDVNRLLKMHQEMANAMKKIRKMGGLGKLGAMFGGGGMGGLGGLLGGGGAPGGPAVPPPGGSGGFPGLPGGGSAPVKQPPGFDKFLKK
jgi:signal recognition particle subunit SRP54